MDTFDPFAALAGAAAKIVTDAWTAAMLGLWNAGLWLLRLALTFVDFLLTPDLTEGGPGAWLYRVMFWIAGALLLIMAMVQLGVAVMKRDGKSLARVAIGFGQFMIVWGGWIAYGVTIVTAAGGLTRALMHGLLNVTSWTAWQPWQPFTPSDLTDATAATVLGLMGLLLWIAAIGHFLVMLVRAAALMVLIATAPIAAAGLVSDAGRSWFWKSLRWFHAAALSPVIMVLVLGVGVQFTTGVANGLTGVQGAIGTAVPGVILICIATVSPLALFKLLSFVDPATTSGASLRASMAAVGGLQGLLSGQASGGGSNRASATDDQGRSAGEDGAADATNSRFTSAVQGGTNGLGGAGHLAAKGLGLIAGVGTAGAAVGADVTNQMGVGHNTYPPDFSPAGRRASYGGSSEPGGEGDEPGGSGPDAACSDFPDAGPGPGVPSDAGTFPTGSSSFGAGAGRPALPPSATGAGSSGAAAAGEVTASDAAVLLV
ncbi:MAG: hypothetical protein IPL36_07530 [Nigerium sp.]|nr:hypothetical protein [Nigerium sp.]